MLTLLDPWKVREKVWNLLSNVSGIERVLLSQLVMQSKLHLFECGGRLLAVRKADDALEVVAILGKQQSSFRAVVKALKKLAADWDCKKIVTWTEDKRALELMRRFGAKPVAWQLMLETEDGW